MPKRRARTLKAGGFFDSLSQGASNWWNKAKNAVSGSNSSYGTGSSSFFGNSGSSYGSSGSSGFFGNSSSSYPSSSYGSSGSSGFFGNSGSSYGTSSGTYGSYGGKTRRHRRKMKGGFKDNISQTGLAANAASFSGPTAKPHTMVGGRSRKRCKKCKKSRKCRRHR